MEHDTAIGITEGLAAYGCVIRTDEDSSEDHAFQAFHPEDAKRLVACWNYCRGIETSVLEQSEFTPKG